MRRTELERLRPFSIPIIERYGNIDVVREDLIPGGTKSRFIHRFFDDVDEVVYASPRQGGAQTALALAAKKLGKQLTLFVAAAKNRHPRVELSKALGAKIIEVEMGFLNNVQLRAKRYADEQRLLRGRAVRNLGFGLVSSEAIAVIAQAAQQIPRPEQLWCAAGSGVLARGLAKAWFDVPRFIVQCGHKLTRDEAAGGTIIQCNKAYSYQERRLPPFPSDPTYERKAYFIMLEHVGKSRATFWNTAASAEEEEEKLAAP